MIVLSRTKLFFLLLAVIVVTALAVSYRHSVISWVQGKEGATLSSSEATPGQMAAQHAGHDMPSPAPSGEAEREILYWYDPMHPAYRADQPGIAPDCGMQLVPKYADEAAALADLAPGTVQISPERQQLIGVRTTEVKVEHLSRPVRAVGIVEIDETRIAHVHTKVRGWVRQLYVDYTWQYVEKGQPLFTLYSPDLFSAQKEYLLALRARDYLGEAPYQEVAQGSTSLLQSARERLRLWDVSQEQISQLEATGKPQEEITFYAPVNGHVQTRNIFPNQYVTPADDLYTLVDHSHVWVQAQLYEYEIDAVQVGQPVNMTVTALPGRVFRGKAIYIDPHLDYTTRSVNVRVEFANLDLSLKPGMYATVELDLPVGRHVVVPREAVIDTGARQLVFLARGDGYFEPREIEVGPRLEDRIVVLRGLEPGETIVSTTTQPEGHQH
jgi:RND family efflux transporter MFP subunit